MNPLLPRWLGSTLGIGLAFQVAAQLANDGTTTDNLSRLANEFGVNEALAELSVEAGASSILASQTGEGFPFFALRQVWYSNGYMLTNGVYNITADFQPSEAAAERRGGVAGWLDVSAGRGIGFYVRPGGGTASFRLATLDFKADNGSDNESTAGLFNLDGSAANFDLTSAASELGGYDPSKPATFSLAFTPPTATDLAALTNATARITARVQQNNSSVGRTIEALTTLPVPSSATHRFGYLAYWGSLSGSGPIGLLDNLNVSGSATPIPNVPPTVTLAKPVAGFKAEAPVDVQLEATAGDSDGSIRRVEFLSGENVIASSSTAPYTAVWQATNSGSFTLRARAIDERGATTLSSAVTVVITSPGSSTEPPVLTATLNGASLTLSWPETSTGFRLQSTPNLATPAWTDVPSQDNKATVSISTGSAFYRLTNP